MALDRITKSVKGFFDVLLEIVVELLVLGTNTGKKIVNIGLEFTEFLRLCLCKSADSLFKSIEIPRLSIP